MNKQYIRILAEVAIVLSAAGMMTGCVNKTAKDVNSSKAEIVITTDAETTADEIIADSSSNFESSSSLNESSLSDNSASSSIADSKVDSKADSKVESTTTTTVGNIENPQNYIEVYEPIYNVTTAPQIEPVLDEETPELGEPVTEPVVDTTPVLDEETPTEVLAPESTDDSKVDYSGAAYTPHDLYYNGRLYYGNYQYTWYSERVLPGYGLQISGRHTDADGFVCDGDGYICVAASSLSKGTVVDTPFGRQGKVYDSGCAWNVIDCYVNW